jgi:hypothetical protein
MFPGMTKKPYTWIQICTIARSLAARLVAAREEFLAQQAQGASAGPGNGIDKHPTDIADRSGGEESAAALRIKYLGLASPRPGYAAGLVLAVGCVH